MKMTNKQTFYKNVVFILCAAAIFQQRKKYKQQSWYYITQWGPVVLMAVFALFVQIHCLLHEPWHDFRPWKVGNFIAAETYAQAPEVDYVFRYKNNNDQSIKELTMDELTKISSDSTIDFENNYTYFDRAEKIIAAGINAKLSDFAIMDIESREDIKNEAIMSPDYTFIIMVRDITNISKKGIAAMLTLVKECEAAEINCFVVTASLKEDIDTFNIKNGTELNFYQCDATPLKTAVRNNPGVILLKEGYVMDKWSYRDIPAFAALVAKFPKYDAKLIKYKRNIPPKLPNGKTLEEQFAE